MSTTTITADDIITAARSLLGTRWLHQGRTEQGIDCCGFIVEVALRSGAPVAVDFERDYRREENGERMLTLLDAHLLQVEPRDDEEFDPEIHTEFRDTTSWRWADSRPGDILALVDPQLKYLTIPRHLMFLTAKEPYWTGIHASEHGVREHRLDIQFKRRVHSIWRVPGLAG